MCDTLLHLFFLILVYLLGGGETDFYLELYWLTKNALKPETTCFHWTLILADLEASEEKGDRLSLLTTDKINRRRSDQCAFGIIWRWGICSWIGDLQFEKQSALFHRTFF